MGEVQYKECHCWNVALLGAASECETGTVNPSNKARLLNWCAGFEALFLLFTVNQLTMHPAISEILGYRLMKSLGMGCAPVVELVSRDEARSRDPLKWVFKSILGGRLKICPAEKLPTDGPVLAVEKIAGAIPISWLRHKYGIAASAKSISNLAAMVVMCPLDKELVNLRLNQGADLNTLTWQIMKELLWRGKEPIANADAFYSDFVPPEDWAPVRQTIEWHSPEMLKIHAARAFLGTTAAHSSNVLVDHYGKLHAIDFESCCFTKGSDLDLLFASVAPGTMAHDGLCSVARITEYELLSLFNDLPPGFEFPLGSKEKTEEYYVNRLVLAGARCFKESYGSAREALPKLQCLNPAGFPAPEVLF